MATDNKVYGKSGNSASAHSGKDSGSAVYGKGPRLSLKAGTVIRARRGATDSSAKEGSQGKVPGGLEKAFRQGRPERSENKAAGFKPRRPERGNVWHKDSPASADSGARRADPREEYRAPAFPQERQADLTSAPDGSRCERDFRQDRARKSSDRKGFIREKSSSVATGAHSRAVAAQLVDGVSRGKSLSDTMPRLLSTLQDPRDQALAAEIAYGVLRVRRLLNSNVQLMLDHKIGQHDSVIGALIICGLYQLVFMRSPQHAVVSATVGACALLKRREFTGLVNALLRRFLREGTHLVHPQEPAVNFSFPDWLYERLVHDYGEDKAFEIMRGSNERAPMFLRVDTDKMSVDAYCRLLEDVLPEVSVVRSEASGLIELSDPVSTSMLPRFADGTVSVQDLSAQRAAALLDIQAGDRVLDCCCAPGGKTAHILALQPDAQVVAMDADGQRLYSAYENLLRLHRVEEGMGRPYYVSLSVAGEGRRNKARERKQELHFDKEFTSGRVRLQVKDASTLNPAEDGMFERILVDAPCSGTGVIRRHPDIKWLRRDKDIPALCELQQRILEAAFSCLKPGGMLVYSTCSVLTEENSAQITAFMERHKADAKWLPFVLPGDREAVPYRQVLPGESGGDGFFYARIRKVN